MKKHDVPTPKDSCAAFNVISCPEIITAGKPFSLFLQINEPVELSLTSNYVSLSEGESLVFEETGLYAVNFLCDRIVNDLTFTLSCGSHTESCTLLRSLEKPIDDNVFTGIGTADPSNIENLLRLCMSEHIGNMITFYDTENSLIFNCPALKKLCALMNKLGVKYSVSVEKEHSFNLKQCSPQEQRYQYRLAMYLSYMHGVSEINCRDFSPNPLLLKEQQDFYRYVLSHTRSGNLYTPFAFLHAGYAGFSTARSEIFNSSSQNLLKLFCVQKDKLEQYKAISLADCGKAKKSDFDDLLAFVQTGGTLIMGWPHLSVSSEIKDTEKDKHNYIEHNLVHYICADSSEFINDSYRATPIDVCPNMKCDDVIATTDSGIPLAFMKKVGLGRIFFINAQQQPENQGVNSLYAVITSEILDDLSAEEKTYLCYDNNIAFTVFNQKDGTRHLYVLAIDQSSTSNTMCHAVLKVNKVKYDIDVPLNGMLKIVAKDGIAAWSEDEAVEILLIVGNVITLQGYGKTKIKIAQGGKLIEREVDFTHKPIQAIQI